MKSFLVVDFGAAIARLFRQSRVSLVERLPFEVFTEVKALVIGPRCLFVELQRIPEWLFSFALFGEYFGLHAHMSDTLIIMSAKYAEWFER